MARKNSAWGVFLSVAVSAVVGYVMLLIFTWCIPNGDVTTTANDAYPVLQIVYGNLSTFFANVIAVIIGVAMWLCGLASITSMARMWYAFARDDGMPGSGLIKQVSPKYRTPVNSIIITSVLSVLICLYASAYFVVTSISMITLYLAYMFPIYLNWRNKRRGTGEFTDAADGALEPGQLGADRQRHRHRLGAVPDGHLQPAAERARALDHAGVDRRADAVLAGVGQAQLRRARRGPTSRRFGSWKRRWGRSTPGWLPDKDGGPGATGQSASVAASSRSCGTLRAMCQRWKYEVSLKAE